MTNFFWLKNTKTLLRCLLNYIVYRIYIKPLNRYKKDLPMFLNTEDNKTSGLIKIK